MNEECMVDCQQFTPLICRRQNELFSGVSDAFIGIFVVWKINPNASSRKQFPVVNTRAVCINLQNTFHVLFLTIAVTFALVVVKVFVLQAVVAVIGDISRTILITGHALLTADESAAAC
jgi:uncharacterized membrane protein YgcG